MSWRHELAARLPEGGDPNRSGPPGSTDLRNDILDELEDHLQCAMDREAIGTTDPHVARRRVLDRFGDPATIARRLFFDAMKEQLMNQRLAVGINLLVGAVVVVIGIVAIMTARNGQAFQAELLERMERIAASVTAAAAPTAPVAAVDSMQWGKLEARVVDELGTPVAGASVRLHGNMYEPGKSSQFSVVTDDDGFAAFPLVLPNNYNLRTTLPNELWTSQSILITPGPPTMHETVAPAPRDPDPHPVRLRLEFPTELDGVAGFAAVQVVLAFADPAKAAWQHPTIGLALRHDGKVARLPDSLPLFGGAAPVSVSMDALEWSDTLDLDRALRIRLLTNSMLWLAVDTTHPNLVYRASNPRASGALIELDELPYDDGEALVAFRFTDALFAGVPRDQVSVRTGDRSFSRVKVPSLEWVGDPPSR